MRALFLVGRAICRDFFVLSGISRAQHRQNMRRYAASKGVPAAQPAVRATGLMLPAEGPITLQIHRFREEQDPVKRQAETINFMKNMDAAPV
jgi:hypothetical protein